MDSTELLQMRLRDQLIAAHEPVTPRDVISRLGAMQAQDLLGAKWAVALRCGGQVTEADIDRAIAEKQLVRSWPMRGTLHFVAPEDLRWMLEVTTPRLFAGVGSRERALQLDEGIFKRAGEAATEGLRGGRALERKDMLALFEQAGVSTEKQRGYHILWHLAQQGLLCFGPMKGKQPTFVLADEWLPPTQPIPRDEALARFARVYFEAHGPATVKDFARWTGIVMGEARAGLKAIAEELENAIVDGNEYWWLRDNGAAPAASSDKTMHLLPGFDEYTVGYADRTIMFGEFHEEYHKQVAANGMFAPVIVSHGQVIGMWKRQLKAREVVVSPQPFRKLDKTERKDLAEEITRYGEYLGLNARQADE